MRNKKMISLMAGLLLSTAAIAQTEVTNFQPGATLDGINYFLPQTALRVTVVAEKKVVTPGRFNKYAFRYLRLNDAPTESSTTWSIKSVTVDAYGVPDAKKAYNVKFKAKTSAPLLSLTKDGLILAINADKQETMLPAQPKAEPAKAPLDANPYMNQEMLQAGSAAKIAELCAQEIYDIRESRNELVRGESDNLPKDGEQLKLMLQQLDTQNQALSELFCGSTQTSTEVFTFNYNPTQATERDVLFRFSQRMGVVEADDLVGAPVYISIQPQEQPAPAQNAEVDKKKAKMQEKGIFYNVPARTKVRVFDVSQTFAQQETPMPQFGSVEILSDVLFDKHMDTRVFFHQHTGGVEKVEQ